MTSITSPLLIVIALVGGLTGGGFSEARGQDGSEILLELSLSVPTAVAAIEPAYATVTLRNNGATPVTVVALSGGWASALVLNFDIEGPPYREGLDRVAVAYDAGAGSSQGIIGGVSSRTLLPGERTVGEFNLSEYADIARPGSYRIRASYCRSLLEPTASPREVHSTTITVQVAPATESEQALISEYLTYEGRDLEHGVISSARPPAFYEQMGFEPKYLQALETYPNLAIAKYLRCYLGGYYVAVERTADAVANLEPVIELPSFVLSDDAMLRLARCYRKLGREADAATMFARLVQDYPNGNAVEEARAAGELP